MNIELTREELKHNNEILKKENRQLETEVFELSRKLEAEKEAKNRAYCFILESGLLEQYKEFCKFKLYGNNPHKEAFNYIAWEREIFSQDNIDIMYLN